MTKPKPKHPAPLPKALIYCPNASSKHDDASQGRYQLDLCNGYARDQGYKVIKVFSERGVQGAPLERPGIKALLETLDTLQDENCLVLVSDPSSVARNLGELSEFESVIEALGSQLHFPCLNRERDPEIAFQIEILRALGALERRKRERECA